MNVLSKLQSSDETTLGEFLSGARQLDEIRTAVYLSGTDVRDYLLEPDRERAEQSRLASATTRFKIEAMLSDPASLPRLPDQSLYESLEAGATGRHLGSSGSEPEMERPATASGRLPVPARCGSSTTVQHPQHCGHHRGGKSTAAFGAGSPAPRYVLQPAQPFDRGVGVDVLLRIFAGVRQHRSSSSTGAPDPGASVPK